MQVLTPLQIIRITIPVIIGYIPLGIAFGILAVSVNIPWYYALLMSIVIFAGSGQFLAVALFAANSTFIEIFIAIFFVNLRHFFYGLSMINEFKALRGWAKRYAIFGLTDETFAILKSTDIKKNDRQKIFTCITALNQFYWVFGSFLGAYLGSKIDLDFRGIEFVLTSLFVVLTIELYKKNPSQKILIIALFIGFFGMLFLPSSNMLILSLLIATISILLLQKWIKNG